MDVRIFGYTEQNYKSCVIHLYGGQISKSSEIFHTRKSLGYASKIIEIHMFQQVHHYPRIYKHWYESFKHTLGSYFLVSLSILPGSR